MPGLEVAAPLGAVFGLAEQARDTYSKRHEKLIVTASRISSHNTVAIDNRSKSGGGRRLALIVVRGIVGVAVGTRGSDQAELVAQFPIESLTASTILDLLEIHLDQ
jgi:hypothetical protein